jgi:hypothetical protein
MAEEKKEGNQTLVLDPSKKGYFPKEKEKYQRLLEVLQDIAHALRNAKRCVPKGDVIGFNRINIGIDFEEMYTPYYQEDQKNPNAQKMWMADFGKCKEIITDDEHTEARRMLRDIGDYINVIVYEVDYGWKLWPIFRDRIQNTVLCLDNQVIDLFSEDGKACLLGAGTEYFSYFEIPSGYPEMPKVMHYAVKTLMYRKMLSQLMGEQFNMVNTILNYEPGFKREIAIDKVNQPIVNKTVKE